MALELFFHFRRRLNGFYLAGLQGDRLQFLPTEAFAAQLEHRSIIKDAVQCAEQGGVLVEILAPQRWIFVAGENHMDLAKRFKTVMTEMGVKRLTVKARVRAGEYWTKEMADSANIEMRKNIYGSQY